MLSPLFCGVILVSVLALMAVTGNLAIANLARRDAASFSVNIFCLLAQGVVAAVQVFFIVKAVR